MRKFKLDLDELEVESFHVGGGGGIGTVRGREDTVFLNDGDTQVNCNNTEYTCSCQTDCVAGSCTHCSGVQATCGTTYCAPGCGATAGTCEGSCNTCNTCAQNCTVQSAGCNSQYSDCTCYPAGC